MLEMIKVNSDLFLGFTEQQEKLISDLLVEKKVSIAKKLICSTQDHDKVFVLLEGGFDITLHDDAGEYVVATLETPGDFVGGQALWGGGPIASVIARKKTRYYELDVRLLNNHPEVKSVLTQNVSKMAFEKLRDSNENILSNLKHQVFLSKIVSIIFLIACMSVLYNSIWDFLGYKPSLIWSWVYMLLFMPVVMVYIRHSGRSLEYFGVTKKRWMQSLLDGVVASTAFLFLFLLFFYFFIGSSLKQLSGFFEVFLHRVSGVESFLYLIHSYAQEFFARGIMQIGLCELIEAKDSTLRTFVAICMASLAFGITHTPFGFSVVMATILSGIIFGYLYIRTHNLIGVTLFHFFSGTCFFALLTLLGVNAAI